MISEFCPHLCLWCQHSDSYRMMSRVSSSEFCEASSAGGQAWVGMTSRKQVSHGKRGQLQEGGVGEGGMSNVPSSGEGREGKINRYNWSVYKTVRSSNSIFCLLHGWIFGFDGCWLSSGRSTENSSKLYMLCIFHWNILFKNSIGKKIMWFFSLIRYKRISRVWNLHCRNRNAMDLDLHLNHWPLLIRIRY